MMNLTVGGVLPNANKCISTQPFFLPEDGWVCVRPKTLDLATGLVKSVLDARSNDNFDLEDGASPITMFMAYCGISKINKKCKIDTKSFIQVCCCDNGFNPGDISIKALEDTFRFFKSIDVLDDTVLYDGDILISADETVCAIIVSGNERDSDTVASSVSTQCYSKYNGKSDSIIDALNEVGVKDPSMSFRKKIAIANGIANYKGTASQNSKMVSLLKEGKLIKG